jgi:diketogulonate reductase-like aldo/keto reductase
MGPNGSPIADEGVNFMNSWPEVEKLYKAGKAKAIGVSNFHIHKYV